MLGLLSFAALSLFQGGSQTYSRTGMHPPRLVILISIDQFRADYVERYSQYFLPSSDHGKLGGFTFLEKTGAHFRDAMHNHLPTATGPGHATLMSGSEPAYDSIVGNDWFDRVTGKSRYVVDDASVTTVGGTSPPMSPRALTVTTVGDELKMATNGRSKVVGVAIKDRAAILMAGHAADSVIWFDPGTGNWVTSSWYAPSKQLPKWVADLDAEKPADKFANQTWGPLLPPDNYLITRQATGQESTPAPFSHPFPAAGKALNNAILTSRYGNELTFQAVDRAIDGEKLGQHDVPDILVVNLSSNDYVGHKFGPNSPEVMDMTVRTDRELSELFNKLNKQIPGGIDNVAIVITADHGVVPIPQESNDIYKTGAMRGFGVTVGDAVQKALTSKFGEGKWIMGEGLYEQNLYLNRDLAAQKGLKMPDVEETAATAAASVKGIFGAWSRTAILNNAVAPYPWLPRMLNGFNTQLGGDIFVLEAPGDLSDTGIGTSHGTVWDYDAHVPIFLRAKGVRPGQYFGRVYTSGIAPTLCQLLGIEYPSGNVGVPLKDALQQ